MVKDLNNHQALFALVKAAYAKDEATVEALWDEVLRRLDIAYYEDVTIANFPLLVKV